MVRAFSDESIDRTVIDRLCDLARRAPTAGNSQGVSFLVLDQPEDTERYWNCTLPPERRAGFRWQSLLNAPVLVVVTVNPESYVERYGEADKARTGLGEGTQAWSVPYWWVDAGAAAQNLLLGAVDLGLGACLFGLFEHETSVADVFGVPREQRLVATIALGHRVADEPGRSSTRARRDLSQVVHRGRW